VDEDRNNKEGTSGYEKSGVTLARVSLDDLALGFIPAGS